MNTEDTSSSPSFVYAPAPSGDAPIDRLITHALVSPNPADPDLPLIEDGAIAIRGDTVLAVGTTDELRQEYPGAPELDAGGKLALPGSICAHTHFYGAYARGLAIPGPASKNFPEILRRLWWTLDKALDPESVKYSALVCLVDAIRRGTTTLIDHHASPNAIEGSLSLIAEAVKTAGLRACLCYEVSDRDGAGRAEAGIEENVRWIKEARARQDPSLAGTFGLHAALTLSDATLEQARAAAEPLGAGFHIHAAEGPADQEWSLQTYGERVIQRLHRHGILGANTIVAHAITIDPWEMGLLRETGTWVTHQPRSNMNNAVGVADLPAMLRAQMRVGLGNDGFSFDMFQEMKTAYLLHKVHTGDPRTLGGYEVMTLAYANNAALAGRFFPKPVSRLEPGAFADIILVDYHPFTPLSSGNLPWHLLFGFDGGHVTHTIAAGKLLMADRQLLTLDEAEITARARELAPGIWERFDELSHRA
ncbi:MAG: putative aminohydrolase SsnA [Ardenticatenaceae bacterium]|nr:putative aminohydrolase SsnA [Ardenticatenaceae bacterium]